MMKKTGAVLSSLVAVSLLCASLAGCGGTAAEPSSSAASSGTITAISRESGSGTRGAFIELFGIEVKGEDGSKTDMTSPDSPVQSSTNAVMTAVASDPNAIGYISLGSLNDTVKALKVDGADATAENIKSGSYQVSRPFNIATRGEATGLAKDFIDFILSAEGQTVVESSGYIKLDDAPAFAGTKPEGKIVVAGSSSVTPVMEKLKEAYLALNAAATIDIQQSDSTAGMQAAIEGTCDIGMASRELKESETAQLNGVQIALDGIAMIVNHGNPLSDISGEMVKNIYTGSVTSWADVKA